MRDHKPIILNEFNGLWQRGGDDVVPKDHFADVNNVKYGEHSFSTRDAVDTYLPYSRILRVYTFNRSNGESLLILDADGDIYHTTSPNPFLPILSIMGMTDFAFYPVGDRAYLSPSDGIKGLNGEFVYVYDGLGNYSRKAGGNTPVLATTPTNAPKPFTAINSDLVSGTDAINKGLHVFCLFNEAADGSKSILGPEVFPVLNAPGKLQASLINIPIDVTGLTVKRGICCTKAIPNDFDATPVLVYYFLAYINDNVTTTLTGAVLDTELTVDVSVLLGAGTGSNIPPTPVSHAFLAQNGDEGGVQDLGFKLFGVVYETDTGFLTGIGPEYFASVEVVKGDHYINLINIPISSDSHVMFKRIVATKVITDYNGDQTGYQFFFIPGARIANNLSTYRVSFFDADLLDDASHLIDNFEFIPAVVGLGSYHNRLIAWTQFDDISIVRLSAPGEPEAISQIDGLLLTSRDNRPITKCQEFRDVLYVFKNTSTNAYNDNGDVPSSWPGTVLEEGIGCTTHGIAEVLDSGGVNVDYLIIAGFSGIVLFNGSFIIPKLTYKIVDYWTEIDANFLYKLQIINDTIKQRLYVSLPSGILLFGDYSNGLDPTAIKWGLWTFDFRITTISLIERNKLILGAFEQFTHNNNFFVYNGLITLTSTVSALSSRLHTSTYTYAGMIDALGSLIAQTSVGSLNSRSYNSIISAFAGINGIVSRSVSYTYQANLSNAFQEPVMRLLMFVFTSEEELGLPHFYNARSHVYSGLINATAVVQATTSRVRSYHYTGLI